MLSVLNELINDCTDLIMNGGWIVVFLLVLLEAFIPILPLGAFVALNVNAFNFFPGIILSWGATTIGSYLMYLACYYVSNKLIYKFLRPKTITKITERTAHFQKIKLTHLVLIITVPFAPSCFINLLAGISNISKEKYAIALLVGKAFMITFWALIGKSFIESLTNIKAIIFICIILLLAYLITKYISKKFKID